MSVENTVYDFLKARLLEAAEDSSLGNIQLCKTSFEPLEKDRVIQIGPCHSQLAPSAGAEAVEEFDAQQVLICLVRVADSSDKEHYAVARNQVIEIAMAVSLLFFNHSDMDGAVRNCRPLELPRDFVNYSSDEYADGNLIVVVNETENFQRRN